MGGAACFPLTDAPARRRGALGRPDASRRRLSVPDRRRAVAAPIRRAPRGTARLTRDGRPFARLA
eukprot:3353475-Prymnesium_polylepis.1